MNWKIVGAVMGLGLLSALLSLGFAYLQYIGVHPFWLLGGLVTTLALGLGYATRND